MSASHENVTMIQDEDGASGRVDGGGSVGGRILARAAAGGGGTATSIQEFRGDDLLPLHVMLVSAEYSKCTSAVRTSRWLEELMG